MAKKKYRILLDQDNPNLSLIGYGGGRPRSLIANKEINDWFKLQGIYYVGFSCNTMDASVWCVNRLENGRTYRHFVFGNKCKAMAFKLKFG